MTSICQRLLRHRGCDTGSVGIGRDLGQPLQLFIHQQSSRGLGTNWIMPTVEACARGRPERVVDVEIAQRGELFGEPRRSSPPRVKPQILEQQTSPGAASSLRPRVRRNPGHPHGRPAALPALATGFKLISDSLPLGLPRWLASTRPAPCSRAYLCRSELDSCRSKSPARLRQGTLKFNADEQPLFFRSRSRIDSFAIKTSKSVIVARASDSVVGPVRLISAPTAGS